MQRIADVAGLRRTVNRSIHQHIVCSRLDLGRLQWQLPSPVTYWVVGLRISRSIKFENEQQSSWHTLGVGASWPYASMRKSVPSIMAVVEDERTQYPYTTSVLTYSQEVAMLRQCMTTEVVVRSLPETPHSLIAQQYTV